MDFLNTILGYITSFDWTAWSGVIALWILAFDRLAKLTPTTKDDSFVNWVYNIFSVLGVKVPELEQNAKGQVVAVSAK